MSRIRVARVVNRSSFYLFFSIACFIYLIPLFFILFTALKSPAELFSAQNTLFSFGGMRRQPVQLRDIGGCRRSARGPFQIWRRAGALCN